GGALYLAFGLCAALLEAQRSGKGQVIDCAMTDGAASLMTMFYGMRSAGLWNDRRDDNLLDGAAHFYDTYACADGKWLAIGAIEPQFHALLIPALGMDGAEFPDRMNRANWPAYSARIAHAVRQKPRDEWAAVFEGTDACVSPVLSMSEAPEHPHNVARDTFLDVFGAVQPAPAPRFSRTAGNVQGPPALPGQQSRQVMLDWGVDQQMVETLLKGGAIVQSRLDRPAPR
ncbi:MAG: CoA transferase, partial [Alphaproteobacteria bacterium]|nr:CoA transferase [Alphaproteobacteria bacterium]